jgi:hypothetical protein
MPVISTGRFRGRTTSRAPLTRLALRREIRARGAGRTFSCSEESQKRSTPTQLAGIAGVEQQDHHLSRTERKVVSP